MGDAVLATTTTTPAAVNPVLAEKAAAAPEIETAGSNARSWKYFAEQINAAWRKGSGAFMGVGRILLEAKEELDKDEFSALLKLRLDLDASVGRKLMCCASNSTLCAHVHKLPPCWSTLYELSKVPDETLKEAIADGRVTPKMMRRDAIALRKQKSGDAKRPPGPYSPETLSKLSASDRARILAALDPYAAEVLQRLPEADRKRMIADLGVTRADVPSAVAADLVQHAVTQEKHSAKAQQTRAVKFIAKVRSAVATNEAPIRQIGNIRAAIEAYEADGIRPLDWRDRVNYEASRFTNATPKQNTGPVPAALDPTHPPTKH